jgi:hypothetical protein
MIAKTKSKDLFSAEITIQNFGVESNKKLLVKAGVNKDSQIQTIFLGKSNHILSCISNKDNLKISLLAPEIVKLHEFQFNKTLTNKPSLFDSNDPSFNIIGKILTTTQINDDFILKIGIVVKQNLEIYKMRFSVEEGKKEFLLINQVPVPLDVRSISLFSDHLIGLFVNHKELRLVEVNTGTLILKKKIKGRYYMITNHFN